MLFYELIKVLVEEFECKALNKRVIYHVTAKIEVVPDLDDMT